MTPDLPIGRCPFAVWRPTVNFGYPQGRRQQNEPLFFCDHIMGGYKSTMDNTAWLDNSGISAHFGIGRDGSISQYVNIFDSSYANGVSGRRAQDAAAPAAYDRSNVHLANLERAGKWQAVTIGSTPYWALLGGLFGGAVGNLLNSRSITTEHEGLNGATQWTTEMLEADIRVKRWAIDELARVGVPFSTSPFCLVGHYQIDGINRPSCPGSAYPRQTILDRLNQPDSEDGPMIIANGTAPFFGDPNGAPKQFPTAITKQRFWVSRDFKIVAARPRMARLEVELSDGSITFHHGSMRDYYAANFNRDRNRYGTFDVGLDDVGDCFFSVTAGTVIRFIGILGYWQ